MQKHGSLKFFLGCMMSQKGCHPCAAPMDAGYTLIELMIALMILAIGVMGIWSMQGVAIKSNSTARKVTDASAMCSDQFEKLMSLPYDDPDLTPGAHPPRKKGIYTVKWEVSGLNDPITNVKTVRVIASWGELGGEEKKVEYVYYKADQI